MGKWKKTTVWLSLLAASACGGAQQTGAGATGPEDDPAPAAASAPSPTPASSEPASKPDSEQPPELPKAPAATDIGFDFHAWCYERGVEAKLEVDECHPSGLGKPPNDAIWCGRHEESKDGVVTFTRSLYVVRAKKLVKLVDVPYAVGVLGARTPESDSERFKLKLSLARADDGKSVTFADDDRERDCARAEEIVKDYEATEPKLAPGFRTAVKKVCAARGRYAWSGAALSKVGK
jgi:hypothetical protein